MTGRAPRCKDCRTEGVTTVRAAPYPGPRCTTHFRQRRTQIQTRAHEAKIVRTYGLRPGDYKRLLTAQDGVCAGCGPRTGRNGTTGRRLAVDHNHTTGEVRGLLCATCNQQLGDQRDDPDTFQRLANYLRNPPARQVLGQAAP